MRILKALSIVAMGIVAVSVVSAGDAGGKLRFGAAWVTPTGDLTVDLGVEAARAIEQAVVNIEPVDAVGVEIGYEVLLSERIGLDFGLGYADHDIDASAMGVTLTFGSVTMMPLTVGANFHLLPDRNLDLYVAPLVSYVMYGDIDLESDFAVEIGQSKVATKDNFGYGAKLGLDVPLGEKWFLAIGARYLITAVETDEGGDEVEIDVDPWSAHLGVGIRF